MTSGFAADRACFERSGVLRLTLPTSRALVAFLRAQRSVLAEGIARPRPWHYTELHNPWGQCAASYDSWGFLDLCSSEALTDAVAIVLGPDVILYDSQWLPDPWHGTSDPRHWISDVHRLPVEPQLGVTVLLSIEHWGERGIRFEYLQGSHIEGEAAGDVLAIAPAAGELLVFDARLRHRVAGIERTGAPIAYIARYFPATSRYVRRVELPIHQQLTELYPFINYAKMPLWLVRGVDRAANDFVTGFNPRAGRWTSAAW